MIYFRSILMYYFKFVNLVKILTKFIETNPYKQLYKAYLTGIFCVLIVAGYSQKILIMENSRSLKNIKYYPGDEIILKVDHAEKRIFDQILDLTDSTIILDESGTVYFDQITGIYKENWLVQTIRGLSFLAGVGYFGLDSFNRLINNDSPVILAETAIISGSLIAVAAILTPLRYRKFNTQKNWELRTINMDAF